MTSRRRPINILVTLLLIKRRKPHATFDPASTSYSHSRRTITCPFLQSPRLNSKNCSLGAADYMQTLCARRIPSSYLKSKCCNEGGRDQTADMQICARPRGQSWHVIAGKIDHSFRSDTVTSEHVLRLAEDGECSGGERY